VLSVYIFIAIVWLIVCTVGYIVLSLIEPSDHQMRQSLAKGALGAVIWPVFIVRLLIHMYHYAYGIKNE